jgi:hypothetical protein
MNKEFFTVLVLVLSLVVVTVFAHNFSAAQSLRLTNNFLFSFPHFNIFIKVLKLYIIVSYIFDI